MKLETWAARRRRMDAELSREIATAWKQMHLCTTSFTTRRSIARYVDLRYLQARRDA